MHAGDLEVGHTYVVLVPYRLPIDHSLDGDRLTVLAGTRFRFTVTAIDTACEPVIAVGLRFVERCYVQITLTDDQADGLGLCPDRQYRVFGSLIDSDRHPVYVPTAESLRIPVQWLYTTDDPD
ncbi:hypothetical protein A9X06_05030 [Mycobacterium sp. 852002-51759_SCH5129042]|nr:hypothetical protein A9X06_05030 [Mycobacterium sp. 852002-51759_SCH5129042]